MLGNPFKTLADTASAPEGCIGGGVKVTFQQLFVIYATRRCACLQPHAFELWTRPFAGHPDSARNSKLRTKLRLHLHKTL